MDLNLRFQRMAEAGQEATRKAEVDREADRQRKALGSAQRDFFAAADTHTTDPAVCREVARRAIVWRNALTKHGLLAHWFRHASHVASLSANGKWEPDQGEPLAASTAIMALVFDEGMDEDGLTESLANLQSALDCYPPTEYGPRVAVRLVQNTISKAFMHQLGWSVEQWEAAWQRLDGQIEAGKVELSQRVEPANTPPEIEATPEAAENVEYEYHVTLQQAASIVSKSKRTLERAKQEDTSFPTPDVIGGDGKADEWKWSTIRPYLVGKFGRDLPELFPADPLKCLHGTADMTTDTRAEDRRQP